MSRESSSPPLNFERAWPVWRDFLLVFTMLVAACIAEVVALVYFYMPARKSQAIARASEALAVTVEDRAAAVQLWTTERLGDARVASIALSHNLIHGVDDASTMDASTRYLDIVVRNYGYRAAYIVDDKGLRLKTRDAPADHCVAEYATLSERRRAPLIDFCRNDERNAEVVVTALIPPASPPAGERPGVLVLVEDPAETLFGILAAPALGVRTQDVGLVRAEDGWMRRLNPTGPQPAMQHRRHLKGSALEAAHAAGRQKVALNLDYRGVEVLSQFSPIPNTSWELGVKMDLDEATAPAREEIKRIALMLIAVSILAAWAGFTLLRLARMRRMHGAEEQFRKLFQNSTSAIGVFDIVYAADGSAVDHRAVALNPAGERLLGVTAADVVGRTSAAAPVIAWPSDIAAANYRVAETGEPIQYERFNASIGRSLTASVFSPRRGRIAVLAEDVTDRRATEEVLRVVSENSFLGVVGHDGLRFRFVNDSAAAMFGYTREEMLLLEPLAIVAAESLPPAEERMRRRLSEEAHKEVFEFVGITKGGEKRVVEAFVVETQFRGRPFTIGTLIDLTAHRATEAALRKSQEWFRRVVDHANEGIVILDQDNRIEYANAQYGDIFGCSVAELVGHTPTEFVVPDELDDDVRTVEQRRQGISARFERTIRRMSGELRTCSVASVPLLDEQGQYQGGFAMVTDITERVASERQLRRLGEAIAQLAEAIVLANADGIIEYVNPAFERTTGYAAAEAIGRKWPFLATASGDLSVHQEITDALQAGQRWQGLLATRRNDDTIFEEEVSVTPVHDAAGRILGLIAVKRDVTRERSLQAQLNQAQKMEAIGTLAGGVAHDFNNLLMAMNMMLTVAERDPQLSRKVASVVTQLQQVVKRGTSLTKQLLLFSRRDVAQRELLDLNTAVQDVSQFLRRLVRENVDLRVDVAKDPLPVTVDRSQLEQVLANLVLNATDAMPDGGVLRIWTSSQDGGCVIVVEDSGTGIAAEIRDRIFEPFFTTKEREKGTGLGLSVVHGIVAEHGGTITVDDRDGGGTRFRIAFPRSPNVPTPPADAANDIPLPLGHGERVLVVEDDDDVREGLLQMLEILGYRCWSARSGEAAVDFVSDETSFDLLLTDFMLPGRNGEDVARELSSRWPGMRSVLMSGYISDPKVRAAVSEGKLHALEKPFGLEALAHALSTALLT